MPRSSALLALGVDSPDDAVTSAQRLLARAPRCRCCISHRVHLARYVGSTLFSDDEPRRLAEAVPRTERTPWTERLFAACIVLHGRDRQAPRR